MIRKFAMAFIMVYIPIILMSMGISGIILFIIHGIILILISAVMIYVEFQSNNPEWGVLPIFWIPVINILLFIEIIKDNKTKEIFEDLEYDIYHFYPIEKIRNFYYNMINGISNIFKWWKVIWNDRNYDSGFVFKIMEFKFENMEKFFNSDNAWSKDAKRDAKRIMVAKNLCKRIVRDSDYLKNAIVKHHKKYGYDSKLEFKPVEGKPGFMEMINNSSEEEKKSFSRACEHAECMKKQDIEFLFNYLKKHLRSWWD